MNLSNRFAWAQLKIFVVAPSTHKHLLHLHANLDAKQETELFMLEINSQYEYLEDTSTSILTAPGSQITHPRTPAGMVDSLGKPQTSRGQSTSQAERRGDTPDRRCYNEKCLTNTTMVAHADLDAFWSPMNSTLS